MTEIVDSITLGVTSGSARTFLVKDNKPREAPVSDFAAQVRIGEPTYDNRQGAGFGIIETLHLGGGVLNSRTRTDLSRWAWNTGVDTRLQGYGLLPPAVVSQTVTGTVASVGTTEAGSHYATVRGDGNSAVVMVVIGDGLATLTPTGTAIVAATPTGAPTLATWYKPVVMSPVSSGTTRWYVSNASKLYYSATPAPAVGDWTQFTMPASRTPNAIAEFDQRLIIQCDNGQFIWSSNGTSFITDSGGSDPDIIAWGPLGLQWLGNYFSPWGEAAPYYVDLTGQVYILHFDARRLVPAFRLAVRGCWCPYQGGFVAAGGSRVTQYLINGGQISLRDIPIWPDEGAIAGETWKVVSLMATQDDRLYAQLQKSSSIWIWEFNGTAWNPYGQAYTDTDQIASSIFAYNDNDTWASGDQLVVWSFAHDVVAPATLAHKITGPSNARNPLVDTSYAYDTSGTPYVETGKMDMGFRELSGVILEIWHGSSTLSASKTVRVDYELNGSASWTTLGTLSTQSPLRLRFGTADASGAIPGIEFRTIAFRFYPVGTSTTTPNILPMTLVFRKKGLLRLGFTYTIDASRMIENPALVTGWGATITWENIMDYLRTLWGTHTLLYLLEPDRTSTRVSIATYTGLKENIRANDRNGEVQIQFEEPVDGA